MRLAPLFLLALVACKSISVRTGDMGGDCNPDGTCNSPHLVCNFITERCMVSPQDDTSVTRFCETCASRCSDAGIQQCGSSLPGVYGPGLVCVCK